MATRGPGSNSNGRDQSRSGGSRPGKGQPSSGFLAALGIVALVGIVAVLVYGSLREGVFLALVILVVLAAIFPPLVIGLGLAIIAYLAVARGGLVTLFGWLGSLAQRSETPLASGGPFTPLGPTLPGYSPSQTQSSYGLPKF